MHTVDPNGWASGNPSHAVWCCQYMLSYHANSVLKHKIFCAHNTRAPISSHPHKVKEWAARNCKSIFRTSISVDAIPPVVLFSHRNSIACPKTIINSWGSNSTPMLFGPERCCLALSGAIWAPNSTPEMHPVLFAQDIAVAFWHSPDAIRPEFAY